MANEVVAGSDANVKALFDKMRGRFAEILPKHMTPDRLIKTALIAINKMPKLLKCTQTSLAQAMMTAGELGLDVSGTLGSAYLVPFDNNKKGVTECQLIVGYRGLIELARRSGNISTIEAHIVHERDKFSVRLGTDSGIEHVPEWNGDRGAAVAAYAVAKLADGGIQFDVMTVADIEKVRSKSRGKNLAPWVENWNEMAKKTVVRRLSKYLPLSVEMEKAMAIDVESEEILRDAEILTPELPSSKSSSRMAALAAKVAPKPDPEPEPAPADDQPQRTSLFADDDAPPWDGPTQHEH